MLYAMKCYLQESYLEKDYLQNCYLRECLESFQSNEAVDHYSAPKMTQY